MVVRTSLMTERKDCFSVGKIILKHWARVVSPTLPHSLYLGSVKIPTVCPYRVLLASKLLSFPSLQNTAHLILYNPDEQEGQQPPPLFIGNSCKKASWLAHATPAGTGSSAWTPVDWFLGLLTLLHGMCLWDSHIASSFRQSWKSGVV